ncbi:MAG: EamA family transporter [Prevotella sp.]|jgi:transporter family protein|nr:EamA family transporter [Prevotella sp.]
MWKYYAILSAIFAALTAIFAKIGIKDVDSNLATAIRTCVILFITWGIVFASNGINSVKELTKMNWIFLILSGVATGLSWLFYFKALQLGDASKVAPIDKLSVVFTIFLSFIILKETVSWKVILGGLLIAGGSLVILMDKQ